jgi:aspartyl-tRNA(Asn)/glutamyl-tRNA(Gln) amidotransferase subunit C
LAVSVAREEARRIAALARLRFDDEELARITGELNRILEHMEDLRALESRTVQGDGGGDVLSTRGPDAERPDELRRGVASLAPDWREGFFVVPPLPGTQAEGA